MLRFCRSPPGRRHPPGAGLYRRPDVCGEHLEKGAVGALHHHPHTQITYVVSGAFEFTVDGETHTVRAGDTILKEDGVEHGCVCTEPVSCWTSLPYAGGFCLSKVQTEPESKQNSTLNALCSVSGCCFTEKLRITCSGCTRRWPWRRLPAPMALMTVARRSRRHRQRTHLALVLPSSPSVTMQPCLLVSRPGWWSG